MRVPVVGIRTLEVGLRVGASSGPGSGITWDVDAASGKGAPSTAAQWDRVLAAAGIVSGGPSHLYGLQESSGNVLDAIGSSDLTAFGGGTTQGNAVPGWTRKAASTVDGGGDHGVFTSSFGDLAASSFLALVYARCSATPVAERGIFGAGSAGDYREANATTGPFIKAKENGGNAAAGSSSLGTTVHPVILQINRAASTFRVVTNAETVTPTYTAPSGGGSLFVLGSALTGAGPFDYLYATCFVGAAAELTAPQIASLLTTLGW